MKPLCPNASYSPFFTFFHMAPKTPRQQRLQEKWGVHLEGILKHYSAFRPHDEKGSRLIEKAFLFAAQKHGGQTRDDGKTGYFVHPVAAALKAARTGADAQTIAASLLHDVGEDCKVSYPALQKKFGTEVAEIVDLVSKPKIAAGGKWVFLSDENYHKVEDEFRGLEKADLALHDKRVDVFYDRLHDSGNARALFVKLFDNLDNMRSIRNVAEDKRENNIAACLKYNLWYAKKIHPSLHEEFEKAVYWGLRSLGWNDARIKSSIEKYAPKPLACPAERVVATPKFFDKHYFLMFEPAKHENALLIYHATDTGERMIRVPRDPKTMGKGAEKAGLLKIVEILRSHGLDVEAVAHKYPRLYRSAFLLKLKSGAPNAAVSRRLGEIERTHFKHLAQQR